MAMAMVDLVRHGTSNICSVSYDTGALPRVEYITFTEPMSFVRLHHCSLLLLGLLMLPRGSGASFQHVLQVILYKDAARPDLADCPQPSIDALAASVRQFLQGKVTQVVHDDDFVIGNVVDAQNMAPQKGDPAAVEFNFHLKCPFCDFLGHTLRSDNPDSNYNVAYMLRWALQYYLEHNIQTTLDEALSTCLTDEFRILVRVNRRTV